MPAGHSILLLAGRRRCLFVLPRLTSLTNGVDNRRLLNVRRSSLHCTRFYVLNFRRFFAFAVCFIAAAALAETNTQPPIWVSTPGLAVFEKCGNAHLARAQPAVAQLASAKGPRTIARTREPFDEAV